MTNEYTEAGDHPLDETVAMRHDISKTANEDGYEGQSIGFDADPGYDVRGSAEPSRNERNKVKGLMPEDEEQNQDSAEEVFRFD